jgi:hypothetical protein
MQAPLTYKMRQYVPPKWWKPPITVHAVITMTGQSLLPWTSWILQSLLSAQKHCKVPLDDLYQGPQNCRQETTKEPFHFMFCWSCISIYAGNETNLMHYLSSVYSVTIPLKVSGLLVAHHQEVTMPIRDNWFHSIQVHRQSTKMHNTYKLSHIYIVTSWWWATSNPESCRGKVTE